MHSNLAGDYILFVHITPTTESSHTRAVPHISGRGYLCTPRGERYNLRLGGDFEKASGTDLQGKKAYIYMHNYTVMSGSTAPSLEFHASGTTLTWCLTTAARLPRLRSRRQARQSSYASLRTGGGAAHAASRQLVRLQAACSAMKAGSPPHSSHVIPDWREFERLHSISVCGEILPHSSSLEYHRTRFLNDLVLPIVHSVITRWGLYRV